MEFNEFFEKIDELAQKINLKITENEVKKLYTYMVKLIEWNENINLTAITDPDDIILKHFIDSITINKFINKNSSMIDIGTGAGFPGIPVGVTRGDVQVTLMDSLNKRIKFLDEIVNINQLENVKTIHSRAEELAQNINFREKYDVATSRAVAALNVLLEYMLPFVKVGGYCICMKGSNIDQEIEDAKKAIEILGGKLEKIENFNLPNSDMARNIVIIKKVRQTPKKYPRKAGTPSKEPII